MIRSILQFVRVSSYSCRDLSVRISRLLDGELPVGERLAVRAHFVTCRPCRHLAQQMLFLRAAAARVGRPGLGADALGMPKDVRARIGRTLQH